MKLADFNNLHAGRRAFAIGNGPSLKAMDLSPLAGEITFAANRFYQHAARFGFMPIYLCVSDPHMHQAIAADLPDLPCTCFLPDIPNYYKPGRLAANEFALPYVWGPGRWLTHENFRRELPGTFHSGNTVVIDFMIQLAFCMGITELYLIGCDCSTAAGRYFYDSSPAFAPIPRRDVILECYRICRDVYAAASRTLGNAGIGGELEVLPRTSFPSLFAGSIA